MSSTQSSRRQLQQINERYVPNHGDASWDSEQYDLELDYSPETNRLAGKATITARAAEDISSFALDLYSLRVRKVTVNGKPPRKYVHRNNRLVVTTAGSIAAGSQFSVMVTYSGSPQPMPGIDGEAGWEELEEGAIVASQPHGAPSWFPCNDRPNDKAPYSFAVSVPVGFEVFANGQRGQTRRKSGSVTFNFEQVEPMSSYLATIHVGRFIVSEDATSGVPIRVVSSPELLDASAAAFADVPKMMEFFEDRFGPYPFASGYSNVVTDDELEIPLEAQSLSIFGANFLTRRWEHQRLIAHELAHQWFGNAVTSTSWRDIWLHEGFACYSEWLWSEQAGQATTGHRARHFHSGLSAKPQDLLLADPGPEMMFDDRVYKRGALALFALHHEVGDESFFELLRLWVDRFGGTNANTGDFLALATQVCGVDASVLLDPWLNEVRLPPLPS
ncbi:MAG TPA: M1 family metallopeptidase [Aeromicrobium sp.]|nr:M1 family metallopeptidase [Aeromicrobium sp.]